MAQELFDSPLPSEYAALARERVADRALQFVEEGLFDIVHTRVAPLDGLATLLSSHCLNAIRRYALGNGRGNASRLDANGSEKALPAALEAFMRSYVEVALRLRYTRTAPSLGLLNAVADAEMIQRMCDTKPLAYQPEDVQVDQPLQVAYDVTALNMQRTEQRLTTLSVLAKAAQQHGQLPSSVSTQIEVAMTHLREQRHDHRFNLLAIGTLLGGNALEQNRRMVKDLFGPNMAVMHLQTPDGYLPGRWAGSVESLLRDAIKNA